ncbi:MAG: PSP1 C-terminal domain-containing protein [Planctomycetota bacterium]
MNADHLVKTGLLGAVGCFRSADRQIHPRDTHVVCRTARGLEVGTVLCSLNDDNPSPLPDGELLRVVGSEDQMLLTRLDKFRDRAFNACNQLLKDRGLSAVLVDVEHLFDGESLYFYFLGEPDPRVEALTAELADAYERKVKFRKFAETLAAGCGPECGTKDCSSSGSCAGCALAGGCGK